MWRAEAGDVARPRWPVPGRAGEAGRGLGIGGRRHRGGCRELSGQRCSVRAGGQCPDLVKEAGGVDSGRARLCIKPLLQTGPSTTPGRWRSGEVVPQDQPGPKTVTNQVQTLKGEG